MNNISMLCMQIPKKQLLNHESKNTFRKFNTINTNQTIVLEIHKLSKLFFNEIPNSKQNKKEIEFTRVRKQITNQSSKQKSKIFKDVQNIFDNKKNLKRAVNFYQLQNYYHEILEQQVYEPYFISNNTILQYENQDSNKKLSFCQIIQQFIKESKNQSKLYFKVGDDQSNYKQEKKMPKSKQSQKAYYIEDIFCVNNDQREKNLTLNVDDLEDNMTPFYTNEKENFWKNKAMQTQNVEYFEFDLKKIEVEKQKNQSVHTSVLVKIDFESYEPNNIFILINIRNISNIIKTQQRLSDQMYLDATEQNYSHEQMTPLNSILANSKIIYRRFQELMKNQQDQLKEKKDEKNYEKAKRKNEESLKILKAIHQSGQIMWYYNQNQIQRMKIKKNEFQQRQTFTSNFEEHIERVINPFEPQISNRNLKIFIAKKRNFNFKIKIDWLMYQLILFNIIQNAVKYNMFEGNIIIILDCKPQKQIKKKNNLISNDDSQKFNQEETYIFETEIIDTGIGISEDRQNMLFIPFMELKMRQNLKQVQDYNIGMGLGCSQQIVSKLGGDITVKSSKRGLTVFAFKVPVAVQYNLKQIDQHSQSSNLSQIQSKDFSNMFGDSNIIKQNIEVQEVKKQALEYINDMNINISLTKMKFAEIELPPENNVQMLHIINQQNQNYNAKKKLKISSSEDLNDDKNKNQPIIKVKQFKSFKQIVQKNNSFKFNLKNRNNQNNLSQNGFESPNAVQYSLNIKQQQKSLKNYNKLPLGKDDNNNLENHQILNDQISQNSLNRSMCNDLLMLEGQNFQSKINQHYLYQLQKQINIDNENKIKMNQDVKSVIVDKNMQIIEIQQREVNKSRRFTLNQNKIISNPLESNLLIKSNSQKAIPLIQLFAEIQNQEIIEIQEAPINMKDENIIEQKLKILKPQNTLQNKESKIQIMNKNINKDLTIEEKKHLAVNILLNNHQDDLQKKIGFDLRNNNQDVQEDLIINYSQDSQEKDYYFSSQEDSLVFDIVINDFNLQDRNLQKQSQVISFQQQAAQQLQKFKLSHNQKFSSMFANEQNILDKEQINLFDKSKIEKEQISLQINKNNLNQNISQYFQDNESEYSCDFQNLLFDQQDQNNKKNDNLCKGNPFKILEIFKQNQNLKQNNIMQNQLFDLNNAKYQGIEQNEFKNEIIEQDQNLKQNQQLNLIVQENLELINENPSQKDSNNSDKSKQQKDKLKILKSFDNSPGGIQQNKKKMSIEEEKEKAIDVGKQKQNKQNLKIGLMSKNKLLQNISSNKLLQLPELEIPKYLENENGCGCIPKILVVDDIEFNIIPVKMMIKENFDIDIEEAQDGSIALQKYKDLFMSPCGCENRTYSLIFMDLQMPIMGGKESSQKILNFMQEQNLNNSGSLIQKVETSIVVLSAFTDQKLKDECFEIGIKKFLNKPLHYQKLHKIMSIYYYKIIKEQYKEIYKEMFEKSYDSSQN